MKAAARIVVDLAFGDSGKGTFVDHLVRRHASDLVVRWNGGPQAAHHVVLPDGRSHVFSHFGAGTFVSGVRTLLAHSVVIEPYALRNEAAHLRQVGVADALARLSIDERCRVITPVQRIANQLRERARGAAPHGTCGIGFGECVADSITDAARCLRAADFRDPPRMQAKLRQALEAKRAVLQPWRGLAEAAQLRVLDDPAWIEPFCAAAEQVAAAVTIVAPAAANQLVRTSAAPVLEGAQGVLLDQDFGFHPHTTWSDTTFGPAEELLRSAEFVGVTERVGVLRTYMTRHGAGPLVTEAGELRAALPERSNDDSGAQGAFRRGVLDAVAIAYALAACRGVDSLAISHLDRLPALPPKICTGYQDAHGRLDKLPLIDPANLELRGALTARLAACAPEFAPFPTGDVERFLDAIEKRFRVPVRYASHGPTFVQKHERR